MLNCLYYFQVVLLQASCYPQTGITIQKDKKRRGEEKYYVAALDKELRIYLTKQISKESVELGYGEGYRFTTARRLIRLFPFYSELERKELLSFVKNIKNRSEDYVLFSYGNPKVVLEKNKKKIKQIAQNWFVIKTLFEI